MSGQKANRSFGVVRGVGAEIAFNAAGGVPEWIMVVPAGKDGLIETVDGRGPYRVSDVAQLLQRSLHAAGGRLALDENHSTDLAAPNGGPSPARGWIIELQPRDGAIYGRVDWSASGSELMTEKAYRYISPVFTHDKAGNILALLRASLTNTPNLIGMAALNSQTENDMDLLQQLRTVLGLGDDAGADAVVAKIKGMGDGTAMHSIALAAGLAQDASQETVLATVKALKAGAALASIAKAAGLKEDADAPAIVAAVTALAAQTPDQVKALQTELASVTTRLNTALEETRKDKATAFVDGEIDRGRVGLKPMRDHYIARHAASPQAAADVEKEVKAMPILQPGELLSTLPPAQSQNDSTNPVTLAAAATAYQKKLADQGQVIDYATAVRAVAEQGAK